MKGLVELGKSIEVVFLGGISYFVLIIIYQN